MPYISTISYEDADAHLKSVYDSIIKSRGKLADVHKIQSLNPDALVAHMELYMVTMFGKSSLKRYQREMIGVVVSASNRCNYCINHHEQALLAYWKKKDKTEQLIHNRTALQLEEVDERLCDLAEILTLNKESSYKHHIADLKLTGLSDRVILDAVQIIAYFNFVNRMVLGLGVEFNDEEMKGYAY